MKSLPAILGLLAAVGMAGSFAFTRSTGNMPWFDERLCIDGNSYVSSMAGLPGSAGVFDLKDLYHSPGYQVLLRAILKWGGNADIPRRVKLLAWLAAAATTALTFWIGETFFGRAVGAAAALLLAYSAKWTAYMNLLQYEIFLAFFLTAMAAAVLRGRGLAAGLCAAASCFIHFRILGTAGLAAWSLSKSKRLGLFFVPFLALAGWSVYWTFRTGVPILVQALPAWSEQVRRHNNPAALGYPLPEVDIIEPSGLLFIAARPLRYAWLLKERFCYLWDLKKDLWYVGLPEGPAERLLHWAACVLFFGGVAAKLRRGQFWRHSILYFTPGAVLAGTLLAPGSSRYLVPVLPFVCLFQAFALVSAAERISGTIRPRPRRAGGRTPSVRSRG